MIVRTIETAVALAEIDKLIAQHRQWRGQPNEPGHRTYIVLKAVRAELQAETPLRISEALRELQAALTALEQSRTDLGYSVECLNDVGYKARAYWPTLRKALAFFEDARKADAQ